VKISEYPTKYSRNICLGFGNAGVNSVRHKLSFFLLPNKIVQKQCDHLLQQNLQDYIKLVIIKKLYYDARPTKYQDVLFLYSIFNMQGFLGLMKIMLTLRLLMSYIYIWSAYS